MLIFYLKFFKLKCPSIVEKLYKKLMNFICNSLSLSESLQKCHFLPFLMQIFDIAYELLRFYSYHFAVLDHLLLVILIVDNFFK